ncbi:hypothetical protein STEG23_013959, partial [Scotinomys teguina]
IPELCMGKELHYGMMELKGPGREVPRTGWLYRNLENPESVSDLIYQMAIMTMVTRHDHLNKNW